MTKLQRCVWIDYIKFIGIFLIVYGHTEISKFEFSFLWTFHVPLFFLVAGFLSVKKNNQLDIRKKIDRLLLPYVYMYLIAVVISFTMRFLADKQVNILIFFKSVIGVFWATHSYSYFMNVPLWFLPSLFTVELIFYLCNNKNRWLLVIFPLISIFLYTHKIVDAFLSIDLSLLGLNYYVLGYALKNKNFINKLENIANLALLLSASVSFLIVLFLAKHNNVWYTGNSIYAYFISFGGGSIGCIMIISISLLLQRIFGELNLVTYISQNTILILGFHLFSNQLAYVMLSHLPFLPSLSKKLLVPTLSILILIPVMISINKFCPQIGGRKLYKSDL